MSRPMPQCKRSVSSNAHDAVAREGDETYHGSHSDGYDGLQVVFIHDPRPRGACSWSGPDPKGGGGGPPPLYRPQNGCTEQRVLWAPDILF